MRAKLSAKEHRQQEIETNNMVFGRLDKRLRVGKHYLDRDLSLGRMCELAGANRTYVSRAVCSRYKNVREYINTLRIDTLFDELSQHLIKPALLEDPDAFAGRYGFRSRKSLDRILLKETGTTYSELKRNILSKF